MSAWKLTISGTKEVYITQDTGVMTKFVGRFKYASPKASANHFAKFLKANFTPAEYFAMIDVGVPPLTALKTKGYVSHNELKIAKALARREQRLIDNENVEAQF